jgi:hypothetical protein
MKVHLMYRDRDFDLERVPPKNSQVLREDLDLDTLLTTMAQGDAFLLAVAEAGLFASLTEPQEIVYRQDVMRDCLEHPEIVRELYEIAVDAVEAERRGHSFFGLGSRSTASIMSSAVGLLGMLLEMLQRLRAVADEHAEAFHSKGFETFFAMIFRELDDEYLASVEGHLGELQLRHGARMSVSLGRGAAGTDYVLHRRHRSGRRIGARLADAVGLSGHVYRVADRDEAGARALGELRARGTDLVANAAAQSAEHIRDFFRLLRAELGFYLAAINLRERLGACEQPICFPEPQPSKRATLLARGLYEPCLTLRLGRRVVGSDVQAEGKQLLMVTGANQGGKSTFLRSLGIAQLMMQCGIYVAAQELSANTCTALFTHFKRKEDASMNSGKLDEELARMSEIAELAHPHSMVLFNESFAATDEREGAELAQAIVSALIDTGSKVAFVTHMFDLAHPLYVEERKRGLFLRAGREQDGRRSFQLQEAQPLPTSYGEDIFRRVFGTDRACPAGGSTAA